MESDDNDDMSIDSDVEARPTSETRMIRELGNGTGTLVSSRPAPIRHEPLPQAQQAPTITRVRTLYDYALLAPIPVQPIVSHRKQSRAELEVVQADAIAVLFLLLSSFLLLLIKFTRKGHKRLQGFPVRSALRPGYQLVRAARTSSAT